MFRKNVPLILDLAEKLTLMQEYGDRPEFRGMVQSLQHTIDMFYEQFQAKLVEMEAGSEKTPSQIVPFRKAASGN